MRLTYDQLDVLLVSIDTTESFLLLLSHGLGNPYFACFYGIVTNTVRFNQLQNIDLPVDFVFDERYGTDTEVLMFL
jgi:hypothetical protein